MAEQFCLKTGRLEIPGSIPDRACRSSRLEFSVVFYETRVSMGKDPLERPQLQAQISEAYSWLYSYNTTEPK